jgi:hypothetical protein
MVSFVAGVGAFAGGAAQGRRETVALEQDQIKVERERLDVMIASLTDGVASMIGKFGPDVEEWTGQQQGLLKTHMKMLRDNVAAINEGLGFQHFSGPDETVGVFTNATSQAQKAERERDVAIAFERRKAEALAAGKAAGTPAGPTIEEQGALARALAQAKAEGERLGALPLGERVKERTALAEAQARGTLAGSMSNEQRAELAKMVEQAEAEGARLGALPFEEQLTQAQQLAEARAEGGAAGAIAGGRTTEEEAARAAMIAGSVARAQLDEQPTTQEKAEAAKLIERAVQEGRLLGFTPEQQATAAGLIAQAQAGARIQAAYEALDLTTYTEFARAQKIAARLELMPVGFQRTLMSRLLGVAASNEFTVLMGDLQRLEQNGQAGTAEYDLTLQRINAKIRENPMGGTTAPQFEYDAVTGLTITDAAFSTEQVLGIQRELGRLDVSLRILDDTILAIMANPSAFGFLGTARGAAQGVFLALGDTISLAGVDVRAWSQQAFDQLQELTGDQNPADRGMFFDPQLAINQVIENTLAAELLKLRVSRGDASVRALSKAWSDAKDDTRLTGFTTPETVRERLGQIKLEFELERRLLLQQVNVEGNGGLPRLGGEPPQILPPPLPDDRSVLEQIQDGVQVPAGVIRDFLMEGLGVAP